MKKPDRSAEGAICRRDLEVLDDTLNEIHTEERLRELYKFFETTGALYVQVRRWPTAAVLKFMKTGDKVLKVLGLGA